MSNFVVEFKLDTKIYQEHILEKRFEIARKIYNDLVTKTQKRYHELVKTKKYRGIQETLLECRTNKNDNLRKECLKELNLLYKEYGIGEYFFIQMLRIHSIILKKI